MCRLLVDRRPRRRLFPMAPLMPPPISRRHDFTSLRRDGARLPVPCFLLCHKALLVILPPSSMGPAWPDTSTHTPSSHLSPTPSPSRPRMSNTQGPTPRYPPDNAHTLCAHASPLPHPSGPQPQSTTYPKRQCPRSKTRRPLPCPAIHRFTRERSTPSYTSRASPTLRDTHHTPRSRTSHPLGYCGITLPTKAHSHHARAPKSCCGSWSSRRRRRSSGRR
jgi:hypothetical protein